jgi:hypothetical protein
VATEAARSRRSRPSSPVVTGQHHLARSPSTVRPSQRFSCWCRTAAGASSQPAMPCAARGIDTSFPLARAHGPWSVCRLPPKDGSCSWTATSSTTPSPVTCPPIRPRSWPTRRSQPDAVANLIEQAGAAYRLMTPAGPRQRVRPEPASPGELGADGARRLDQGMGQNARSTPATTVPHLRPTAGVRPYPPALCRVPLRTLLRVGQVQPVPRPGSPRAGHRVHDGPAIVSARRPGNRALSRRPSVSHLERKVLARVRPGTINDCLANSSSPKARSIIRRKGAVGV